MESLDSSTGNYQLILALTPKLATLWLLILVVHGNLRFLHLCQIVTDVEEADLAQQLERAEEENREVAGDDDEESEEEGMGAAPSDDDEETEQ